MNIIVFNNYYKVIVMNKFDELGVVYYYNDKDLDVNWFKEQFPNDYNHSLYWLSESTIVNCKASALQDKTEIPSFCIYFNEAVVYNNQLVWCTLIAYLFDKLLGYDKVVDYSILKPFLDKTNVDKIEYIPEGTVSTYEGEKCTIISVPPERYNYGQPYEFYYKYVVDNDTMYYQVIRPNTVLPFVVCIQAYTEMKKDHTWFFTDIYGSKAWDSNRIDCRYDFTFLQKTWHNLGMPGDFTTELVKKRVDSCYPDRLQPGEMLQAEPRIFRRNIDEVIKNDLKQTEHFIKRRKRT